METTENYAGPTGKPDEPEAPVPAASSPKEGECDAEKKRYEELNDRYLRLAADFDNFRKRTVRERETIMHLANERFAVDILEIADNLERALKADDTHLRDGVVQIRALFADILARHGITPIDALQKPFDPALHEAIVHVPSDAEAGIIIDEVSRGYLMHEKVLRYVKVAVSKGKNNAQ
jgi:molecular chaperone GrpE